MNTVRGKDIYTHSESVLFRRESKNRVLVVNSQLDELYEVDEIAAEFFLALDGIKNIDSIKKELIKKYEPPKAQFEKDLNNLLEDLITNGLITKV